jgi:hypothetical protein
MYGTDERLCNGSIRLSVIGCGSTALCRSNRDCGGKMLSKEYLDTARTLLRVALTMTDQQVAGKLKALAEDYERRAEKAAHADAAKALARSAARECEAPYALDGGDGHRPEHLWVLRTPANVGGPSRFALDSFEG